MNQSIINRRSKRVKCSPVATLGDWFPDVMRECTTKKKKIPTFHAITSVEKTITINTSIFMNNLLSTTSHVIERRNNSEELRLCVGRCVSLTSVLQLPIVYKQKKLLGWLWFMIMREAKRLTQHSCNLTRLISRCFEKIYNIILCYHMVSF